VPVCKRKENLKPVDYCRSTQQLRLSIDAARRIVLVAAAAVAPLIHARIDQHSHLLLATIIPSTT
jgi:hypothetical protein